MLLQILCTSSLYCTESKRSSLMLNFLINHYWNLSCFKIAFRQPTELNYPVDHYYIIRVEEGLSLSYVTLTELQVSDLVMELGFGLGFGFKLSPPEDSFFFISAASTSPLLSFSSFPSFTQFLEANSFNTSAQKEVRYKFQICSMHKRWEVNSEMVTLPSKLMSR